ncbi:MAG: RNA methyltransferase [Chloroflexi bacterium]|nr:RNA methyltransferase [Chloroflexota bacterium]MBP8056099.1 RNA methyltransferase [Chloroflexota bacterium]
MTPITSPQNSHIKHLVKLNQRSYRDEQRQTVVEGVREITLALRQGIVPTEAYVCPELLTAAATPLLTHLQQLAHHRATTLFSLTPELFAKVAYRENSGGLLCVVPFWQKPLQALENPTLVAVLEGVEKPGNLGGILRTADAAGVSAILVCGEGTDIYNPNAIRASLGAIFTVPVIAAAAPTLRTWLQEQNLTLIATTPAATRPYTATDLRRPVAILMGSEAEGLSSEWLAAAAEQVQIPMCGTVDSLNVSVATALLLYEAVRQRNK